MEQKAEKSVVLLVDDQEMILKSVSRVLQPHFDLVLTAATPEQAEQHLAQHEVTHIICDYHLGDDLPRGTDLIPTWRERFKTIRKAFIFTGSQRASLPPAPIGVDDILNKPMSAQTLLAKLNV